MYLDLWVLVIWSFCKYQFIRILFRTIHDDASRSKTQVITDMHRMWNFIRMSICQTQFDANIKNTNTTLTVNTYYCTDTVHNLSIFKYIMPSKLCENKICWYHREMNIERSTRKLNIQPPNLWTTLVLIRILMDYTVDALFPVSIHAHCIHREQCITIREGVELVLLYSHTLQCYFTVYM